MSSIVDPPFAKDPPVKVNVNAKTLGLVLLILGAIGILFDLLGLIGILGFCGPYGGICSFPILWLLGDLVAFAAAVVFTTGAYRMYQGNPQGKEWVVYGLLLAAAGAVITTIGNIAAYSGLAFGAGSGAIVALVFYLIIYFIVYYLVVVSRFPGEAALAPPSASGWGGGPAAPPPPPPT